MLLQESILGRVIIMNIEDFSVDIDLKYDMTQSLAFKTQNELEIYAFLPTCKYFHVSATFRLILCRLIRTSFGIRHALPFVG